MKILLIEQRQEVCDLVKKHIEPSEHDITTCTTAADAVNMFQRDFYSLVILGMVLSDADGLTLCRKIRKFPKGQHCLILLLTEQETPDILHSALQAGVDEYLVTSLPEEMLQIRWRVIERGLQWIAERNKAMKALKPSLAKIEQAKQEWEATADALFSVVCLLNEQRQVVRANRALERWKLGDVHTIQGQQVHHIFHPRCSDETCYLRRFLDQSWDALNQGTSAEVEASDPVLKKYLHIQLQPVSDIQEKKLQKSHSFAVIIVRDITARKQTEHQLQQTSEELRAVFRSLPDEYFRLNANGNILDYKSDQDDVSSFSKTFLVRWASGMLPKEAEQEFDMVVAKVLKLGQPGTMRYWMEVTGEGRRYAEIRVFPFIKHEVLVVVRDITEWAANLQ